MPIPLPKKSDPSCAEALPRPRPMSRSQPVSTKYPRAVRMVRTLRRSAQVLLFSTALCAAVAPAAHAASLAQGTAAFNRGDYNRAFRELSPLAWRGNAKALALLGFMYEHGFGAPQAYEAAADLYAQ